MQRVYSSVEAELLQQIDAAAVQKGLNRSKWLYNAIDAYLHQDGAADSTQLAAMRTSLDEQSREIAHLKVLLESQKGEILHLREMEALLASKVIPALPVVPPGGKQEQEFTTQTTKTPLWRKLKFWAWV